MASTILGGTLVTIQTPGPAGKKVNKVLVPRMSIIPAQTRKELYLSVLLDRQKDRM